MGQTTTLPCGCVLNLYPNGKPNIEFDIRKIQGNCPLVWEMLSRGLTKGVFQLESNVGRQWTKKLKPESILHLAALSAILRPGASKNFDENGVSVTQHYCFRKNGEEEVVYYHDSLSNILNNSFGLLIYQEEAMRIAVVTANFSEMEADNLRKAMGKKDAELMKKVEGMYLEKAKTTGILTEEEAKEIFNWIKKSQRYSFNKCLSPNTLVETKDGLKTLEELEIGEEILYPDLYSNTDKFTIVKDKFDNGDKEVFEITLESGKTINCTLNHQFMCDDGFKRTCEEIFRDGHRIVCQDD